MTQNRGTHTTRLPTLNLVGAGRVGQTLARQLEAGFVDEIIRHHDGCAAFRKLVRHVHLLQGIDDGAAIAIIQIGI